MQAFLRHGNAAGRLTAFQVHHARMEDGMGRFFRAQWMRLGLASVVLAACLVALPGGLAWAQAGGCTGLVRNGTFEAGSDGAWTEESNLGHVLISDQWPRGGSLGAWLGGEDGSDDVLSQTITIPASASRVTLVYWWSIHTLEEVHPQDTCTVDLREPGGAVVQVLQTITDEAEPDIWQRSEFDLTAYRGRTLRLVFRGVNDPTNPTDFFFDDVDLQSCGGVHSTYLPLVLKTHPR